MPQALIRPSFDPATFIVTHVVIGTLDVQVMHTPGCVRADAIERRVPAS